VDRLHRAAIASVEKLLDRGNAQTSLSAFVASRINSFTSTGAS
jgi:hypothetical protein